MVQFHLITSAALAATAAASPYHPRLGFRRRDDSLPASSAAPNTNGNPPSETSNALNTPTTTLMTIQTSSSTSTTNAATECQAYDTTSTDGVQNLLDSTGAIDWLDIMLLIFPDGETGWPDKMWTFAFPDEGNSPLTGCGNIGGQCPIDVMCQDYNVPMAYWVFKSVLSLNSKMNTIHQMLNWDGWLSGLSIDQISADFSEVAPSNDFAKWISAAFSMAGGIGTAVDWSKPLRGMIGFAAAGFTMMSLSGESDNDVDTTSVENTLRNFVGSAGNYAASILANATGRGDPSLLPIYTYTTLQHPTARFFDDNTILLDENVDNSTFVNTYNNFGQWVEKKLVDAAIKTVYYILLEDIGRTEDVCNQMVGAYWLPVLDKSGCFMLMRPGVSNGCRDGKPESCFANSWILPSADQPDTFDYLTKMNETYGFNLQDYYTSLIDCALYGNGEVDPTAGVAETMRCFYNVPVLQGFWRTYAMQPVSNLVFNGYLSTTLY